MRNCPDPSPNDPLWNTCIRCGKVGHFLRDCTKPANYALPCNRCGMLGHWANECPSKTGAKKEKEQFPCYICGELGHWSKECTKPKEFLEDQVKKEQEVILKIKREELDKLQQQLWDLYLATTAGEQKDYEKTFQVLRQQLTALYLQLHGKPPPQSLLYPDKANSKKEKEQPFFLDQPTALSKKQQQQQENKAKTVGVVFKTVPKKRAPDKDSLSEQHQEDTKKQKTGSVLGLLSAYGDDEDEDEINNDENNQNTEDVKNTENPEKTDKIVETLDEEDIVNFQAKNLRCE